MAHIDPSIDIDPVLDGDYLILSRQLDAHTASIWQTLRDTGSYLMKCARYIIALIQQGFTFNPGLRAWFIETAIAKILGAMTMVIALSLALNTLYGLLNKQNKTPLDYFTMVLLSTISGFILASFYLKITTVPLIKIAIQSLILLAQIIAITRLALNLQKAPPNSELAMSYKQAIFSCSMNLLMSVTVIGLTATLWINPIVNIELLGAGLLILISLVKLTTLTLPREHVRQLKSFFGFGKESYQQDPSEKRKSKGERFRFFSASHAQQKEENHETPEISNDKAPGIKR